MREHLFKGFYPNENGTTEITFNGEKVKGWWVEGDLVTNYCTGQYFIHPYGDSANESDKVGEEGCLMLFTFEVEPETICEYTGLTDKNGNNIFEGDIVTTGATLLLGNLKGVVEYSSTSARYIISFKNKVYHYEDLTKAEVIGNEWDNPDLLEK